MIHIREIDHLVLRVVDLDAMLQFYCGALGCSIERRNDDIGLVQRMQRVQRQQPRIARARAAKPHPAGLHHGPVMPGQGIAQGFLHGFAHASLVPRLCALEKAAFRHAPGALRQLSRAPAARPKADPGPKNPHFPAAPRDFRLSSAPASH